MDSDGDGIAVGVEISLGDNPAYSTRIINAGTTDDEVDDGLVELQGIIIAPGPYSGADKKHLDFAGYDIKLRRMNGAAATMVALETVVDSFI